MKTQLAAILLFCPVLLLLAAPAHAQQTSPANTDWDALRAVPIGQKLRVETKAGKRTKRRLVAFSNTEITLAHRKRVETIKREQVRTVWRVDPPKRAKRVIFTSVGAGAGLIAGLALGVSLGFKDCGGNCADEGAGILAAIIGLPVGGALAGRALAGHRYRLLYTAP